MTNTSPPPRRWIAGAGLTALLAVALLTWYTMRLLPHSRLPAPRGATYVGRTACASCHVVETKLFAGSRHDLAMQPADSSTVLGDFSNVSFTHFDVVSHFYRRGSGYYVNTDGPDGKLAEFRIAYTFGVYPLQQYLIAMPGGRYQALSIAWDSRARSAGGQRWFHLYPGERVPAGDVLHWTGPEANWNYMCAECHSTNLRKGWRSDSTGYATTWSEIDVSCEACHGPGSVHVEWARKHHAPGTPSAAESRAAASTSDIGGASMPSGESFARRAAALRSAALPPG